MAAFEVNKEVVKLADELLRIGKVYLRMSIFSLTGFNKKMERVREGRIHAGDVVVPLISKLRKKIRNSKKLHDLDKDYYLLIVSRIEENYYTSLSDKHLASRGREISK